MARLILHKRWLLLEAAGICERTAPGKAAPIGQVDGAWNTAFDNMEALFW